MSRTFARVLVRLGLLRPDRLRLPVWTSPLRIVAPLLVETSSGERESVPFLVDSGSSISIISLTRAQMLQLAIPDQRIRRRRSSEAGSVRVTVRHGEIRFWLTKDQRAAPFVVPIDFDETRPPERLALLGLKGVIDQIRWLIDGRPRRGEANGYCLLWDQRPAAERYPS
jgi:hypothetical protein